jgi:ribonucleotide reductase beta subunit family protein with ferritin-like domain
MEKSLLHHPPMVYKLSHGFDYPQFFQYYENALASIWRPQEVSLNADVRDWQHNTTQAERDLIVGILRGFTSTELGIGCYWGDKVCKMTPKPEVHAMARMFSAFEQIHAQAYNYLSDTLGINEFEEFLSDPVAQQKVEKFFQSCSSDKVSLAVFSGAGEGVSLYSSFAILLAFSKDGRFKGLAQIISWSAIDEHCVDGNTEFLTLAGWKKISDYSDQDLVAQFDPATKAVSFVAPSAYIQKQSDEMYEICKKNRFSQYLTPGHTVVDYKEGDMSLRKTDAEKWNPRQSYMPVSGYLENAREITALDRFMIALQADGCIRKKPSKREVFFSLRRDRKINRMRQLLSELVEDYGFTYNEYPVNDKQQIRFSILVPDEYLNYRSKFFDEVYTFDNIPKGFLEEVLHWDGHRSAQSVDSIYYSSREKRNVEFVQTVASLSGYYGHIFTQDDTRWKKFCRQYRIYLKKEDVVYARHSTKEYQSLNEPIDVFCFKVPTQAFLIRRNGLISVTGNCHSEGGCELFRELVAETGISDSETDEIYQGFNAVIENEYAFLDGIFNKIDNKAIPIALEELKAYIKSRANDRLARLGLKPIIPMCSDQIRLADRISSWFDPMVSGQMSTDFFARQKAGDSYVAKPSQDFSTVKLSTLSLELV